MEPISLVFATPIFRAQLDDMEETNTRLEVLILSLEEKEVNRKQNSPQEMHKNVFESEFQFLKRPEPEVVALRDVLYTNLAAFVKSVNQMTDDEVRGLHFDCHSWFHVSRKGAYFQPHNHPNASWSVVYYVNPGDDKVDDPRSSGHIVFDDPRPQASTYLDAANRAMRRDVSSAAIRFRPVARELLIFPSYLVHSVEPYTGDLPRISVAANFWFSA